LGWQSKKFKIKASQIPRNAATIEYVKFRWDAAQRRYWTFYEAVKKDGAFFDLKQHFPRANDVKKTNL